MLSILQFKTVHAVGKKPIDWVLLAPMGEDHQKTQTWKRIEKLRPPEDWENDPTKAASETFVDMKAKWSKIGPAYEAWKKGNEIPEEGTALGAWAGVTQDQAAALKAMGLRTVEAVAEMGDGAVNKLMWPGARELPKLAKAYLEGEAASAKDARIADLEAKLAMLSESMEESKPKRGRPKKEPQGEAA